MGENTMCTCIMNIGVYETDLKLMRPTSTEIDCLTDVERAVCVRAGKNAHQTKMTQKLNEFLLNSKSNQSHKQNFTTYEHEEKIKISIAISISHEVNSFVHRTIWV